MQLLAAGSDGRKDQASADAKFYQSPFFSIGFLHRIPLPSVALHLVLQGYLCANLIETSTRLLWKLLWCVIRTLAHESIWVLKNLQLSVQLEL